MAGACLHHCTIRGVHLIINYPFRSSPTNDTARHDTSRDSLCVWAAGTGPRQLTKDLIASIPEQVASKPGSRGRLLVDPYMRVKVSGWVACDSAVPTPGDDTSTTILMGGFPTCVRTNLALQGTNGTIIAMGDATEVENNPLPATGQVWGVFA